MPTNKNIGRSSTANAGLILQAKPEFDTTEFGLIQTTLNFTLLNENYATLNPRRGTPCPAFVAGDDRTADILGSLDFLAAQTSKFIRSGHCPGIGILQVPCQGAIFTEAES